MATREERQFALDVPRIRLLKIALKNSAGFLTVPFASRKTGLTQGVVRRLLNKYFSSMGTRFGMQAFGGYKGQPLPSPGEPEAPPDEEPRFETPDQAKSYKFEQDSERAGGTDSWWLNY